MSVISYLLLISLLKVLHYLHRVLNSHSLGMSLDLTNTFIHWAICVWISGYYKPNIFSNHFYLCSYCNFAVIASFSFFFFFFFFLPELILQLCYYCFSLALLITGSHIVLISILGRLRRFLSPNICADSLSLL